ncbi:MAG: outer membrane beta-barrel protein [Pyrinomonadaceae bacterium]|nr:outer membrane beta-barrel protein [Pyrinomonadaceae bacterium]
MEISFSKINSRIAAAALAALVAIAANLVSVDAQAPKNEDSGAESTTPKRSATSGRNWNGFYVGAFGGGEFGRSNVVTSTVYASPGYFQTTSVTAINAAGIQQVKPNGFVGGGTFGYNHKKGSLVVGAEFDFSAMTSNKGVTSSAAYPCCSPARFTIDQEIKTRWILTARPRIGVVVGKAMIYGTGGLAVTELRYAGAFTDTFGNATESAAFKKNKAGWTLGGGAEFSVGGNWTVKAEYLFADFARASANSSNLNAGSVASIAALIPGPSAVAYPANVFTHSSDLRTNQVRFGINYHF